MYMFKYVMKRLGLMLFTFLIIFTMCFVLIKLLPIPTNALPGQDPEVVMKTLEGRGWITNIQKGENGVWTYDRVPILIQYGTYLKRIITQGDFGLVTTYGEYMGMNIWEVFVSHLPPTILINIYSTLIGVPIGLGLGILAALKKYHIVKAKMPCLVTALAELNEPRYMTPGGIFDAYKKDITVWGRKDLKDVEDSNLGLKGSPTQIAKASDKVRKGAGEKVVLDPTASVDYIVGKLTEKHVL